MTTRLPAPSLSSRATSLHEALRSASRIASTIALAVFVTASTAEAITIQVDLTQSTYQVQSGDSFDDLLARHREGSAIDSQQYDAAQGLTAQSLGGGRNDYSMMISTVLDVSVTGVYDFQVGTDWGRGGGAQVVDETTGQVIHEYVTPDDVWWNNDWGNSDVFNTVVTLEAGSTYTLRWVGFEDCCAGQATIRFDVDNTGSYGVLNESNMAAYVVPEPTTLVLMGGGLAILARAGRRTISRS